MLAILLLMVNSLVPVGTTYDAIGAVGFESNLLVNNEWHCAGTLVSSGVVLTAKHCADYPERLMVRFRRNPDGSLGSIEQGPGSFYNVSVDYTYSPPGGDVALLYLSWRVTHITPIHMLFTDSNSEEVNILIGGWGREGPEPGEGPKTRLRVCNTSLLSWDLIDVTFPNAWQAPCGPNVNDSGGPVVYGGKVIGVVNFYHHATSLKYLINDPHFNPDV